MKKLLALALALACVVGTVLAAHGSVSSTQNEVVVTETVHYGDPSWMAGKTVTTTTNYRHLYWTTEYSYDTGYETQFRFEPEILYGSYDSLGSFMTYPYTGYGISGGITLDGEGEYSAMLRTLANQVPAGECRDFEVRLADYLTVHIMGIDLWYESDTAFYDWDRTDMLDTINGSAKLEELSAFQSFIIERFSSAVGPEDRATISIYKTDKDQVSQIGVNLIDGTIKSLDGFVTEEGVFFSESHCGANGEYVQAMTGFYFIPWKETEVVNTQGKHQVVPDTDRMEQFYYMEDGDELLLTKVSYTYGQARLLTKQDGVYRLVVLDLNRREELCSFDLGAAETGEEQIYFAWNDEVLCTQIGEQVSLHWCYDGIVRHEFTVPAGENQAAIRSFETAYDQAVYDGERLILVLSRRSWTRHDEYEGYLVCGYDKNGLGFVGSYQSSLTNYELWSMANQQFEMRRPIVQ